MNPEHIPDLPTLNGCHILLIIIGFLIVKRLLVRPVTAKIEAAAGREPSPRGRLPESFFEKGGGPL